MECSKGSKYFRVVAEVWIDGESLADTLKAKGLAKDYDGEGARSEWWEEDLVEFQTCESLDIFLSQQVFKLSSFK